MTKCDNFFTHRYPIDFYNTEVLFFKVHTKYFIIIFLDELQLHMDIALSIVIIQNMDSHALYVH